MLLSAYHRLGQYDSALAFIGRMRRIQLNTNADMRGVLLGAEAASLAGLGRVAELGAVMDEMVRQLGPERQGLTVSNLLENVGLELAAHGHPAEAGRTFDRALAWLQAQSPDQRAGLDARHELASVLNSAGRWDEALAVYRAIGVADSGNGYSRAALGDLAARRGDRAEAERAEEWLRARGSRVKHGAGSKSWAPTFRHASPDCWASAHVRSGCCTRPPSRASADGTRLMRTPTWRRCAPIRASRSGSGQAE